MEGGETLRWDRVCCEREADDNRIKAMGGRKMKETLYCREKGIKKKKGEGCVIVWTAGWGGLVIGTALKKTSPPHLCFCLGKDIITDKLSVELWIQTRTVITKSSMHKVSLPTFLGLMWIIDDLNCEMQMQIWGRLREHMLYVKNCFLKTIYGLFCSYKVCILLWYQNRGLHHTHTHYAHSSIWPQKATAGQWPYVPITHPLGPDSLYGQMSFFLLLVYVLFYYSDLLCPFLFCYPHVSVDSEMYYHSNIIILSPQIQSQGFAITT